MYKTKIAMATPGVCVTGASGAEQRPESPTCSAPCWCPVTPNRPRFLRASRRPLVSFWGAFAVCLAVIIVLAAVRPAHAQVWVGLEATAGGQTQIDLSWEATISSDWTVVAYTIQDSPTGADGTWTWLEILWNDQNLTQPHPGDSYSHTGLTGGTTRYYRLIWGAVRTEGASNTRDDRAEGVSNVTSATTSSATSSTTSD